MIVTAGVPLQCPRTVDAARQHLKGFMPQPRRTGPRGSASGDQQQGETCQAEGGRAGQREKSPGGGCGGERAKSSFRAEMSYGWHPSAHGGSDSQGAPSASCRHADDWETSRWMTGGGRRVERRTHKQTLWMSPATVGRQGVTEGPS